MDYVRLGATGLKVSRLCLGAMTYGTSRWRPCELDEAMAALDVRLEPDEIAFLEEAYVPHRILGHH